MPKDFWTQYDARGSWWLDKDDRLHPGSPSTALRYALSQALPEGCCAGKGMNRSFESPVPGVTLPQLMSVVRALYPASADSMAVADCLAEVVRMEPPRLQGILAMLRMR